MKIGVATFHSSIRNYGANLQAYALQHYLRSLGHEPFFIDYKRRVDLPPQRGILNWIGRNPHNTAMKWNDRLRRPPFIRFQDANLLIDPKLYTEVEELRIAPPIADAYLCGSDQIWNPNFVKEQDERFFWLDFGPGSTRRIAYGTSFGVPDLDATLSNRWAAYAKRFHSIGVREKSGIGLMRILGRDDSVWVPDPTLLLDAKDYAPIQSQDRAHRRPYIYTFMLGFDNVKTATLVTMAAKRFLHLACVENRPLSVLHNLLHGGFRIGPGSWLDQLRLSDLVITNSFHGLAMCLLFHRPFIILLREDKAAEMNDRVTSLLEVVGLQDRALSAFDHERVESLCRENIDWDRVDTDIAAFREIGRLFLKDALA